MEDDQNFELENERFGLSNHKKAWDSNTVIAPSLTHCFEYFIVYICVNLCLKDHIEENMVSYLNIELCNILGNLLNRCTSKSTNSSQIYQPLNHPIYDSM